MYLYTYMVGVGSITSKQVNTLRIQNLPLRKTERKDITIQIVLVGD